MKPPRPSTISRLSNGIAAQAAIDAFKLFEVPVGQTGVGLSLSLALVSLVAPLACLPSGTGSSTAGRRGPGAERGNADPAWSVHARTLVIEEVEAALHERLPYATVFTHLEPAEDLRPFAEPRSTARKPRQGRAADDELDWPQLSASGDPERPPFDLISVSSSSGAQQSGGRRCQDARRPTSASERSPLAEPASRALPRGTRRIRIVSRNVSPTRQI
jgi:hypothetical protein